jgi:hypothetical protein
LFWLWVTAVALAVLNTIAKEFVDKQSMSKRARLGWSALIVVVASVGGILTVRRAVLSGQAIAAIDAKYASRTFTDDQRRALRDALAQCRAPPSAIQIHPISCDPESASFGADLERAIASLGGRLTMKTWPSSGRRMVYRLGSKEWFKRPSMYRTLTKRLARAASLSRARWSKRDSRPK